MVIVFVAIAGGVFYAAYAYNEHQKQRMRAVAASAGLQVDTSTKQPPPIDFELFDRGRGRKVRAQMWRAGENDSVFQYEYTTGSGENSTTYEFTAALVELPFTAPHLTISTENWWSRMKRAVGMRDIEFESPEFNDRYQVQCDDERFAVTLIDPPMIAWMLSPESGRGTVTFEFGGRWMLCQREQLKLEELPSMLFWAQSALTQIPTVLNDLYRP
jgi:hypothetical protein